MLKKYVSLLMCIAILFSAVSINCIAENDIAITSHTDNFLVKEDMESYDKYNSISDVWVSNYALTDMSVALSLETTGNSYGGSGQSLKCIYDFSKTASSTLSFYTNQKIYNEDAYGTPLGQSSRFGFWISTDKNIKLQVRAVDSSSDWQNYTITTDYLNISAGSHFLELNWSDFIPSNDTVYHKYYSLFQLQFIVTKTSTNQSGTVYIDEIGVIPVDNAVRTHGAGFAEAELDSSKWSVQNGSATLDCQSNVYFCENTADGQSVRIDYSGLSSENLPILYYNGDINLQNTAPYIYGEKSVFSFWSYSTQALKLEVSYKDTNSNGAQIECRPVTVDIPKGQHITTLKMSDVAPEGSTVIYKGICQLEVSILPQTESDNDGTLYIDAVGFYDSDTEKELSAKLEDLGKVSIENVYKIYELLNYVNTLPDDCLDDITVYTYSRYEKIMAEYDAIAPYISEIVSETESENERGSIGFATVYDNEHTDWTVMNLGGLVHRKKLIENPSLLTLDTERVLFAQARPFKSPQGYINRIELKSSSAVLDGDGSYVGDGYYNTAYLLRPYVVLRNKTTLAEVIVYGRVVSTAKSKNIDEKQKNIAKAFDNDPDTVWTEISGTHSLDYHFDEPKTFNAIKFSECGSSSSEYTISDFSVEITDVLGNRFKIYSQDEMGQRTGLLDDVYTAKSVHLTITATGNMGIKNIEFVTVQPKQKGITHSSYFTATGFDSAEIYERFPAVSELTDIVLFDFGSWLIDGSFKYNQDGNEYYGETQLSNVVDNLRKNSDCPNIWFCIKNYDKEEIKQIAEKEGITATQAKNRLLSTAQARKNLVDYCVYLCDTYNLYGIDVDYEYPDNKTQWNNYDIFIMELATALHNKGYKLSLALSAYNIDYLSKETVSEIDIVNIMAYDSVYSDGHGRHNGYNGSLSQINYFLDIGFKPQQLVLGLGFYGKKSDNTEYYNYSALLRRYPLAEAYDRNWYGEYYCAGVTATCDKTLLAFQMELGGVFSFTVKSDADYSSAFSLTKAVNNTIGRLTQ